MSDGVVLTILMPFVACGMVFAYRALYKYFTEREEETERDNLSVNMITLRYKK